MEPHSFSPGLINKSQCAKCSRGFIDHTALAQCESCPNKGKCELIGNILMCESCIERENAIRIAKNDRIASREEFFNANTIPINHLAGIIKNPFEFHKIIEERYNHFRSILFGDGNGEESTSEARRRYTRSAEFFKNLSELAIQLAEQERAKLQIENKDYVPTEKVVKAPKVKVTAEEQMAQNLVKARLTKEAQKLVDSKTVGNLEEGINVARARGLGLTLEDARVLIHKTLH